MAHTYGYARASTTAQNLDAQVDALTGPGGVDARDVVVEKASGTREDRPELGRLLAGLREGDTLVVTKLDRLGLSAAHVARLVRDLDDRGVTLRSLSETIDTSSATGRLMVHVLAAVAQMEADLARERTLDGLAAARARGRVGGRPSVMTPTASRLPGSRSPAGRRVPPSPARSASPETPCTGTSRTSPIRPVSSNATASTVSAVPEAAGMGASTRRRLLLVEVQQPDYRERTSLPREWEREPLDTFAA